MSSNVATIAKNLILFKEVASGTVSFVTGATAAAQVTATISTPRFPVSEYIVAVQSNATQTTINVTVNNYREVQSVSGVDFRLASVSFVTGECKDILVEGVFGGNASGTRLIFTLGSAATAAEIISANYKVFEFR
jgi:hypothetical protein